MILWWWFVQAEDGIRYAHECWSSDVCSTDLNHFYHDRFGYREVGVSGACGGCRGPHRDAATAAALAGGGVSRAPGGARGVARGPRVGVLLGASALGAAIGRASCRYRLCPFVSLSAVPVSFKNKMYSYC